MKYFVVSDIHSYFDIFHKAIIDAGFDEKNENHVLIVCGDIFDRGEQPIEVYKYLKGLPKNRRILIRGNHEFLLKDLVERGYSLDHDIHNFTYDTLLRLVGSCYAQEQRNYFEEVYSSIDTNTIEGIMKKRQEYNEKLKKEVFHSDLAKEILDWIFSDDWVNFFELDKYIFVHSFIPTEALWTPNGEKILRPMSNWKRASEANWKRATWGCPWKMALSCESILKQKRKTIVCGHWHTSDFWNNIDYIGTPEKQYDEFWCNPIYLSEKFPYIIGLDACTALTKAINVLVINENMQLEVFNHETRNE